MFFRMVFGMRFFLMDFQLVIFERFLMDVLVFRSARKRPTSEICNTFHAKTCFFKVRACAGAAGKAIKTRKYFLDFFTPAGLAAKMLPK